MEKHRVVFLARHQLRLTTGGRSHFWSDASWNWSLASFFQDDKLSFLLKFLNVYNFLVFFITHTWYPSCCQYPGPWKQIQLWNTSDLHMSEITRDCKMYCAFSKAVRMVVSSEQSQNCYILENLQYNVIILCDIIFFYFFVEFYQKNSIYRPLKSLWKITNK